MVQPSLAPEWHILEWLNTPEPIDLEAQRGTVVVACAFQMLCPGCVAQAIPQLKRTHELFAPRGVLVVGLHTVFEHHAAMAPVSLRAFLLENQIRFPVGVDMPADDGDPIPQTMRIYRMEGTPTWLLINRTGRLHRRFSVIFPTCNSALKSHNSLWSQYPEEQDRMPHLKETLSQGLVISDFTDTIITALDCSRLIDISGK